MCCVSALFFSLQVHFVPILLTRPTPNPSYASGASFCQQFSTPSAARHSYPHSSHRAGSVSASPVQSSLRGCFPGYRMISGMVHTAACWRSSLVCGSSIWIENGRRRGEMALYVLPRAIRSLFPYKWIRSGNKGVMILERSVHQVLLCPQSYSRVCLLSSITFVVSLAYLLTAAVYRPDSLRGLSRWTFAFVMRGSNAGFWKQRRIMAQTPIAPTPRSSTPDAQ